MKRVSKTATNGNGDWLGRAAICLRELLAEHADQAFASWERAALEIGNEVVRRALQTKLQELADAEGELVERAGATYRRHHPGTVTYHSLAGPLRVRRWTYRQRGIHNGPTIVPLELRASLLERTTPALGYAVARGYGSAPSRQLARDLLASARCPPSRATLERMGQALGTQIGADLLLYEPLVRARERLPQDFCAITVGLDVTTVPMDEPCDVSCTHEKTGTHYRMAYVGTVALTRKDRRVVQSRRYASRACDGPGLVLRRMLADVR